MHKATNLVFTLSAALALILGGAWALAPTFEELDRDGDGYISRVEAAALSCLSENFHRIERENDRGLSRAEFGRAMGLYCSSDEPDDEVDDPEDWPPPPP